MENNGEEGLNDLPFDGWEEENEEVDSGVLGLAVDSAAKLEPEPEPEPEPESESELGENEVGKDGNVVFSY